MAVIDISRMLNKETAVWPGDTPFQLLEELRISDGQSVNLTRLKMSAHTGSHIDAPLHFIEGAASVEKLDLTIYWGPAQVVTASKPGGPLFPNDFSGCELTLAPRLLIRSQASDIDPSLFPETFVYPSPELADYLGGNGIFLLGTDGPSMDAENSKTLEGHKALYKNGIYILEWLDLSDVPDGLYELSALPLKIDGGDGSPVRAALRTLN
ncbi:MAG: cyclase family protein [Candidatus Promineifilaceae bacterium]